MTAHYYIGYLHHFIGEAELRTPVVYKATLDNRKLVEAYIARSFWSDFDKDSGRDNTYTFNHCDRAIRFEEGTALSKSEFDVFVRYLGDDTPSEDELEELRKELEGMSNRHAELMKELQVLSARKQDLGRELIVNFFKSFPLVQSVEVLGSHEYNDEGGTNFYVTGFSLKYKEATEEELVEFSRSLFSRSHLLDIRISRLIDDDLISDHDENDADITFGDLISKPYADKVYLDLLESGSWNGYSGDLNDLWPELWQTFGEGCRGEDLWFDRKYYVKD